MLVGHVGHKDLAARAAGDGVGSVAAVAERAARYVLGADFRS